MSLTLQPKGSIGPADAIVGDYTKAPNFLIHNPDIKDKDVRVWLYFASRIQIWTDFSAKRIGDAIGCKPTAVENSIRRLIDAGWLARTKRWRSSKYDYEVVLPLGVQTTAKRPPEKPEEEEHEPEDF